MYEELIRRLENAAGGPEGIRMAHEAADAIIALQAENTELLTQHRMEYCEAAGYDCDELGRLRATLTRLEAERDAAIAGLHSMHTLCMEIGESCPECGGQIDDLLDAACTFCKGTGVSCWKIDPANKNRCAAFEWRGAQGEG